MGVKINSSAWGSVFAVPTCIADEHIKLAGGQQLKVLLYILRCNNEGITVSQIAKGTGMSDSDVKDAMQYWVSVGIITTDGSEPIPHTSVKFTPENLTELPDVVPTYQQVASRALESPEIRALFNEAQLRLGKTIGYDAQAKLLMIHDCYGLPVEVILTIIEFAVSSGKASMKYIEKVAKDWAEKDIVTLEAADAYLKQIRAVEKVWHKFVSMFSVYPPNYTDKRSSYLKKWHLEYKQSLELIYYAYEVTIDRINKPRFEYMDTMLESWHKQGLKNPASVMQAEAKRGNTATSTAKTVLTTSYDSDKYRQKAQAPIEYKRRNSNA